MADETTYTAVSIDQVQDVVPTENNGVAIHVQIDGDPNNLIFLDHEGAILLTRYLLEKGPPALGEEIGLEFPDQLDGEFDVSEVEVAHSRNTQSGQPFVMSFKIGEQTAVTMKLSHREVVRWYRRLGAQIQDYLKSMN